MATRIFLSHPKAHTLAQSRSIDSLGACLRDRGFDPRTLDVEQYDADAPLSAIRRLMTESNGLITVALRRLWVERGSWKKGADVDGASESEASDVWLTSPYCQIEPAMAYQLDLPVFILRERGMIAEGLLEEGVVGTRVSEFSLDLLIFPGERWRRRGFRRILRAGLRVTHPRPGEQMAYHGNIQLTFVISAPPELEAEGDRLFRSHAPWMEATHHREGEKALLSYNVSKAPELSNPMDPSSEPTGNVCFVLTEIYRTAAGVADHFEQADSSWADFPAVVEWMGKCRVTGVAAATIINSLW